MLKLKVSDHEPIHIRQRFTTQNVTKELPHHKIVDHVGFDL